MARRRQHRARARLASSSRGPQIWVATTARPPARRPMLVLTLVPLTLALTLSLTQGLSLATARRR